MTRTHGWEAVERLREWGDRKMPESSRDNQEARITAPPGTPEYQRQLEQQALAAAGSMLRSGIVRIACGIFGLIFLINTIAAVEDAKNDWRRLWNAAFLTAFSMAAAVELLSVAIRGKSVYLSVLLSGIHRQRAKKD
jgi:hypothetical protein